MKLTWIKGEKSTYAECCEILYEIIYQNGCAVLYIDNKFYSAPGTMAECKHKAQKHFKEKFRIIK